MASAIRTGLFHRVWRWHFYAGLLVIPFVVILAVTGSIYLFKPQVEAAIERDIHGGAVMTPDASRLPADDVLAIALAAHPDMALLRYVLPSDAADISAEIELTGAGPNRYLWIDTRTGAILHDVAMADRFMETVKRIHGTLLGGNIGSLLVEIVASWTIIMIVTGLFLWWPRDWAWWRVLVPDSQAFRTRRGLWRQLHGLAGAWMGLVILVILLTGLPWTQVWGDGFTRAKALVGLQSPGQVWFVTLQSGHPPDHDVPANPGLWITDSSRSTAGAGVAIPSGGVSLQTVVARIEAEEFAPPVHIQPPRGENGVWTARAMSPYRPDQETLHLDRWSAEPVMRIRFEDHNWLDRVMGLGIAFHEGALFGWLNQLIGLLAAASVVLLSVSGGAMWWRRRRPAGRIAVPPMPENHRIRVGLGALILVFALFLPAAGATLLLALAVDFVVQVLRRRSAG